MKEREEAAEQICKKQSAPSVNLPQLEVKITG